MQEDPAAQIVGIYYIQLNQYHLTRQISPSPMILFGDVWRCGLIFVWSITSVFLESNINTLFQVFGYRFLFWR